MDLNDAGPTLERRLRAAGLDPDHLEPAAAWRIFRDFADEPVDCDGDTVYVQLGMTDPTDALLHVTFIRHLSLADADGALEPIREIICDLGFQPGPDVPDTAEELSSDDFESLDEFLSEVEARDDFRQAMTLAPAESVVSWSEL